MAATPLLLTLLCGSGLAALYAAWRGRRGDPRLLTLSGWLLIFAAVAGWTARFGDSGTAIAVAACTLFAFAALGLAAWTQRGVGRRRPRRDPAVLSPLASPRRRETVLAVLLAGPLAGAAALLLALSAMRLAAAAGWPEADAIVLAYVAVPVVWTGLAVYAGTRDDPRRKAGLFAGLTLLPAAHLAVLS